MKLHFVRRIALALVALYAFGQASIALAACAMDRGAMAQAMAMPASDTCDDCVTTAPDSVGVACVAHCTADLQLTGVASDAIAAPAMAPLTVAPVPRFRSPPVLAYRPPGNLPRRILLHSFQV